jgi:hypothetical protein
MVTMLLIFCLTGFFVVVFCFGIVHLEENNVEMQFEVLKKKLETVGIETGICVPGQYNHLLCPEVLFFSVLHYFYFLLFSAKLNDF